MNNKPKSGSALCGRSHKKPPETPVGVPGGFALHQGQLYAGSKPSSVTGNPLLSASPAAAVFAPLQQVDKCASRRLNF